jgi:hypothetical protein
MNLIVLDNLVGFMDTLHNVGLICGEIFSIIVVLEHGGVISSG